MTQLISSCFWVWWLGLIYERQNKSILTEWAFLEARKLKMAQEAKEQTPTEEEEEEEEEEEQQQQEEEEGEEEKEKKECEKDKEEEEEMPKDGETKQGEMKKALVLQKTHSSLEFNIKYFLFVLMCSKAIILQC